jgi:transcription initiation factor TFIIIB Brf1 subunit/transcription initiation factor TFIIB
MNSALQHMLQEACETLGLPQETFLISSDVFVLSQGSLRSQGTSLNCILATCNYTAAKRTKQMLFLRQVSELFDVSREDGGRCFKSIRELQTPNT